MISTDDFMEAMQQYIESAQMQASDSIGRIGKMLIDHINMVNKMEKSRTVVGSPDKEKMLADIQTAIKAARDSMAEAMKRQGRVLIQGNGKTALPLEDDK